MTQKAADPRLERTLITVARRYAPALAPAGWQKPGEYSGPLADLALALAEQGVLVVPLQPPAGQGALVTPLWADGLQTLYGALAGALFPSLTAISAYYADQSEPPILLLHGDATPVMLVLASYILPYLAARCGTNPPETERAALLDSVLDWLEADDLSRSDFLHLRQTTLDLLRPLLDSPARPVPLTPAAEGVPIARSRPAPPSLPEARPAGSTPPPTTLPEASSAAKAPSPASLPESSSAAPRPPLPVVFEPRPARRRPPVPRLPE